MSAREERGLVQHGPTIPAVGSSVGPDVVIALFSLLWPSPAAALGLVAGFAWKSLSAARGEHAMNELRSQVALLGGDTARNEGMLALLQAQVDGLERTLVDVAAAVDAMQRADPLADLRTRLFAPDVLFLLGTARDHYAVAQFESRLRRFAGVVAGRVVEPDGDFDLTLHLARAALEVGDGAVLFMRAIAELDLTVRSGGLGVPSYTIRSPASSAAALRHLELGVRAAERYGLVHGAPPRAIGGRLGATIAGETPATVFPVLTEQWTLTEWGTEFLEQIRRAGDAAQAPVPPAA